MKKTKNAMARLVLLSFFILHPSSFLFAQPPSLINYQGRLVDGTNLVNSTVGMTIRLYDAPVAGTLHYANSNLVVVADGLYSTFIGDNTTFGDLDTALTRTQVWLEVEVNGTPLVPRERLVSVPYARQVHGFSIVPFNNVLIGASTSGNNVTGTINAVVGGGFNNVISGTHFGATIGGGVQNLINSTSLGIDNHGTIAGGNNNSIQFSDKATIGGGGNNIVNFSPRSVIGGGVNNSIAQSQSAAIGGGETNSINTFANFAAIGGGNQNSISNNSQHAVIGGGWQNQIRAGSTNSVIGGGAQNTVGVAARYAVIAGGFSNQVGGNIFAPTVSGGRENSVSATFGTVGGGIQNVIQNSAFQSTIGGGIANRMEGASPNSTIAGGQGNIVRSGSAFIGGGDNNVINTSGFHSVIGGGLSNAVQLNVQWSTIAGGKENRIVTNATYAVISGGTENRASGQASTVGGGAFNVADGQYATIPGGDSNYAAPNAFAAGRRAKANHTGAFVWGDFTASDVVSTNNNSVTMRAGGGYRLFSNPTMTLGAQLVPNATSWSSISDRNAKESFAPIDTSDILEKVSALHLTAWTYKDDPGHRRYIGPVAQDFHAAFGLGDDKTINTLDTDGVALAAIQALAKDKDEVRSQVSEVQEKVSVFSVRVSELEEENARLRGELEAIKRILGL